MKGINELILNQATMIEVAQYWLDRMMLENAPKVINIQTYEDIMDMHDKPPCRDCGAMTEYEAFNMCICNGDKDSCHGEIIWPESSKT